VLRQELDSARGPNRKVVFAAIQFLQMWNCWCIERREAMSRFGGVDAIARAMKASPQDPNIQEVAVLCFYNFTCDDDAKRRQELVDANAIYLISHALITHTKRVQTRAPLLLGRLCDLAGHRHFDISVDAGLLEALLSVCKANKLNVDEPDRDKVRAACLKLINKLLL
jgi:hypothetical protein